MKQRYLKVLSLSRQVRLLLKAIFEDTRQQIGKHENIAYYCKQNGIELVRQMLFVGDYTNITDQSVSVDTKKEDGS